MAAPTVDDLDGLLASLNQLKPPGASKNKVAAITTLCMNNIQAETAIVQSFYRALKKAPASHKLGVLYVIDSVVRQWIEKAKASGQDLHVGGRGEPGTYPAAIKRVTELMPALFDDIMKGMPADQKSKLENMITIWERGSTFPAKMLAEFKSKITGQPPAQVNGTPEQTAPLPSNRGPSKKFMAPVPTRPLQTPIGFPPRHLYDQELLPGAIPPPQVNGAPTSHLVQQRNTPMQIEPPAQFAPPQPVQNTTSTDVNSILAALSQVAPPAQTPGFPPSTPGGLPLGLNEQLAALLAKQAAPRPAPVEHTPQQPPQYTQQIPYSYSTPSAPPMPAPVFQAPPLVQQPYSGYPPQPPPSIPQAYSVAPPPSQADPLAQLRGFLPENIINDTQKLIPALQLLQDLQKDGIPPDKWGPVLKALEEQYQAPALAPALAYNTQPDYRQERGRSRSPERGSRGGRGSPVYGSYDANSRSQPDEGRDHRGGQQRRQYRQRSPIADSPGPTAMNGRPMQPKFIGHDNSLPTDNIKVLSRTLFVGGANGTQQEIQEIFERYGRVQTCIANRDKRHAFVKMTTRDHALAAKAGMEDLQNRNDREVMNVARQTKWGVGFGPRECCDYQRGESIIPIHKLTDADMKWLLTAEYGGTGGKRLEGGMVLEEPDIEIGAGVSSKAMSKRIGPDNAPASNKRHREDRDRGGRHGKHKGGDGGYTGYSGVTGGPPPPLIDYGYARPEPVAVATPPAVPGFGFQFGLPPANGQNNTYR